MRLAPAVADQPVRDVRGRERLARAGRHLDQRAGPSLDERLLEVADRALLSRPEPFCVELGQVLEAMPKRATVLVVVIEPRGEAVSGRWNARRRAYEHLDRSRP